MARVAQTHVCLVKHTIQPPVTHLVQPVAPHLLLAGQVSGTLRVQQQHLLEHAQIGRYVLWASRTKLCRLPLHEIASVTHVPHVRVRVMINGTRRVQ